MDELTMLGAEMGEPQGEAATFPDAPIREVDRPISERLAFGTDLHNDLVKKLRRRRQASEDFMRQRFEAWRRTDHHLRLYIDTSAKARTVDGNTIDNMLEFPFKRGIAMPLTYTTLMVHLYQGYSMMTARDPMIHLEGRGPEDLKPARAMEALLRYDVQQMGANRVLYGMLYDVNRYGIGIIVDDFAEDWRMVRNPEYRRMSQAGIYPPWMLPQQKVWMLTRQYCRWRNADPFKYRPDPNVPISDPQSGQWIGHETDEQYLDLVAGSLDNDGVYINVEECKKLIKTRDQLEQADHGRDTTGTFDMAGSSDEADPLGVVRVFNVQCRIIPADWKLSDTDRPEVWQFALACSSTRGEGTEVIIRAHPLAFDHQEYGYAVAQGHPDPYAAHTPGIAEHLDGFQRWQNWLVTSHLQNMIRALNNQLMFSSAFIEQDDITNPGPMFHVRTTEEGDRAIREGRGIKDFIQQLPMQDITRPHMDMAMQLFELAQRITAANDVSQGIPLPDKRTLGEVQSVMAQSSQRIAMHVKLVDEMLMQPLASRAVANRQQFTTIEQILRLLPDEAKRMGQEFLKITPGDLMGNFDYIPHTPQQMPDPARGAEAWMQLMQVGGNMGLFQPDPMTGKMLDKFEVFAQVARVLGVRYIDNFFTSPQELMQQGGMPPGMMPPGMMPPGMPPGLPPGMNAIPDEQLAQMAQSGQLQPMPPELAAMMPPGMGGPAGIPA
jgi:hypothetical protein